MSESPRPIFSTRDEQPELREAIDSFVVRLAERVDALQDAEMTCELDQAGCLAQLLASDAQRLGFDSLAALAHATLSACREEKADQAREAVIGLTEIARRIRLGHRGSL